MFQPNFDETSGDNSSSRLGRLVFVVGEPCGTEAPHDSDRAVDSFHAGSDSDCAQWLNDRLTACYND